MDSKFWNEIYTKKSDEQLSWFQENPSDSIKLIQDLNLSHDSEIIDIGGGNSRLTEELLKLGFHNLNVLDISQAAIDRAQEHLAGNADKINWIVSDVREFRPSKEFDLWHDRATFHFLTAARDIETYLEIAAGSLKQNGFLIVSTFSKNGPDKCSGLAISQYSDEELKLLFSKYFSNIKCFETQHQTPWGTSQSFVYCGFKKI